MFIAIVGTRLAGKSTVESFLVKQKGFLPVKILQNLSDNLVCYVHPHIQTSLSCMLIRMMLRTNRKLPPMSKVSPLARRRNRHSAQTNSTSMDFRFPMPR